MGFGMIGGVIVGRFLFVKKISIRVSNAVSRILLAHSVTKMFVPMFLLT